MSNKLILDLESITTIKDPLRVFFLCGSKFLNNPQNKRKVLKKFLDDLNPNSYCSIILEENFVFNDRKQVNYVKDMNLNNLKDIELIISMLADKIFILHETLSTAAEIGLFSYDLELLEKTTVLVPDQSVVKEDLFSGFLKLAYNTSYHKNNMEVITYYPEGYLYPDVESNPNEYIRKIYTKFKKNEIPTDLEKQIKSSIDQIGSVTISALQKRNPNNIQDNHYYLEDKKVKKKHTKKVKKKHIEKILHVNITVDTIKVLMCSILSRNDLVQEINNRLRIRFRDHTNIKKRIAKLKTIEELGNIIEEQILIFLKEDSELKKEEKENITDTRIRILNPKYKVQEFVNFYFHIMIVCDFLEIKCTGKKAVLSLNNEFKNHILSKYVDVFQNFK